MRQVYFLLPMMLMLSTVYAPPAQAQLRDPAEPAGPCFQTIVLTDGYSNTVEQEIAVAVGDTRTIAINTTLFKKDKE